MDENLGLGVLQYTYVGYFWCPIPWVWFAVIQCTVRLLPELTYILFKTFQIIFVYWVFSSSRASRPLGLLLKFWHFPLKLHLSTWMFGVNGSMHFLNAEYTSTLPFCSLVVIPMNNKGNHFGPWLTTIGIYKLKCHLYMAFCHRVLSSHTSMFKHFN